MQYSHCVEPLFYSSSEDFKVVIKLYSVQIKAIETTISGVLVGSASRSIAGKFCNR